MNILVIEDTDYKLEDIKKNLKLTYDVNRIVSFKSLIESLYFIKNNHDYIDLIILDWCFPMYNNEYPCYGMGNDVLTYLRERNYNINVIICSSDYVYIEDENVKKVVLYDGYNKLDFNIESRNVNKLKK